MTASTLYAEKLEVSTMKRYQNIVTDKPVSYSRYLIIADYDSEEEAKAHYAADVAAWTEKNKGTIAYKIGYPFGFATICDTSV